MHAQSAMDSAQGGPPFFQWGPVMRGTGRGGGGPSTPPILEIDSKGPCDFCKGNHDQSQCTKFRDFYKKAQKELQSQIAAKIAARKAAAADGKSPAEDG